MTTDDAPRGEPLSDEQLRSYGELADELEGDGLEGAAIALDLLLGEVSRLRTENAALRAELAELTQAAELGAAGAFVAGMRVKGEE